MVVRVLPVLLCRSNFKISIHPITKFSTGNMAKSKFEYVRFFEQDNLCLKNCWIIVRIDGKNFHKFTDIHDFKKPNDERGLSLMSKAAASVFEEFKDISLAFGHSDEYSFILKKKTNIFNRRSEKILSLISSIFSSSYVFYWNTFFPDKELLYPPLFDARVVLYPTDENLRDYLSWRQADVHVNNLYNTCFWLLVLEKGLTNSEAEEKLRGTVSGEKNELLYKGFNINYNNEPEMFRKGTVLLRKSLVSGDTRLPVVMKTHCDIIKDKFWNENPELLNLTEAPTVTKNELTNYFILERDSIKAEQKKKKACQLSKCLSE